MYVEELLERNALPDWDLRHTGGFEEIVASLPQDSPLIAVMSMLSPILKNMSETLRMAKTDKESDYYFYVNILLYAVGLYTTVLIKDKGLLHRYPIYDILCFVLNVDDLNDLIRQFTPVMLEECCDYLPLALDTWPELKQRGQCKETDDMDRVGFYTVMYFLSFFVGLLSSSEDLKNTLRMRIACFYKWLRSNRIYLPKELQQQTRDYLDG